MLDSDEFSPKGNQSVSEIVDSNLKYLDKFKLSFNDKYEHLPRIYLIPKLHKKPYKFQFMLLQDSALTKNCQFY